MNIKIEDLKQFMDSSIASEFSAPAGESKDEFDATLAVCIKKFQTYMPCFNAENWSNAAKRSSLTAALPALAKCFQYECQSKIKSTSGKLEELINTQWKEAINWLRNEGKTICSAIASAQIATAINSNIANIVMIGRSENNLAPF